MSRKKTCNERLAEGVLAGRGYEVLDSTNKRKNIHENIAYDPTLYIPGTLPEKIVLNHLISLQVNFNFQYHFMNNYATSYPEDVWVADFYLEDYNTYIEIYGTYWHSTSDSAENDLIKKVYWLNSGYEILEKGLSMHPSGMATIGKVCIWWEEEIYRGVAQLFNRDLPEVMSNRIPGKMKELTFDVYSEWNAKEKREAAINLKKIIPKRVTPKEDFKKLRDRTLVQNIYGKSKNPRRIYRGKGLS